MNDELTDISRVLALFRDGWRIAAVVYEHGIAYWRLRKGEDPFARDVRLPRGWTSPWEAD